MSEGRGRVILAPAAQRHLRRLPPGEAARLRPAILALGLHPHPPGAAKFAGTQYWRLRVGELRIVYAIDGRAVVILRVARRSESTYRGLARPGD